MMKLEQVRENGLRLLQKQTDVTLLRLSLQREIESGIRNFQAGGFKPDEELLERFRQERGAQE